MLLRYTGVVAWTVVMAQILLVGELHLRFIAEQQDEGGALQRRLQLSTRNAPELCFRAPCGLMSYDDATTKCASHGGRLCTVDELPRSAKFDEPIECSKDSADSAESSTGVREGWAAPNPSGSLCAGSTKPFRTGLEDACSSEACSSEYDDCCAPWGEDAMCSDGDTEPIWLGACGEDPEGEYRCCDLGSEYECAAPTELKSVMCCKDLPFREDVNTMRGDDALWRVDPDGCAMVGKGGCASGYSYAATVLRGHCEGSIEVMYSYQGDYEDVPLTATECTDDSTGDVLTFDDFDGWTCQSDHYDDDDDTMAIIFFTSILPSIVFTVLPCLISICGCWHFRNKSMSKAPFNGGPVGSFPRTAQAVLQPQTKTVQMQVPNGLGPGEFGPQLPYDFTICHNVHHILAAKGQV